MNAYGWKETEGLCGVSPFLTDSMTAPLFSTFSTRRHPVNSKLLTKKYESELTPIGESLLE